MIYIVVPIFNRIDQTRSCLRSIYKQSFQNFHIVVVDDGSTDNSSEIITKEFPEVTILNGTGGLFWTGAVHFAINFILRTCKINDWVLLVNNDVILEKNSIKILFDEAIKKERKYILNAISLDICDKNTIIKSGTIVKSWFWNISHHIYHREPYNLLKNLEPVEADLLTGRCLLHPVEVFMQVGNYNNNIFPHYAGDDEFSCRAKKHGFLLAVVPKAKVYLDTKTTGLNKSFLNNGILHLIKGLFGIKSSNSIFTKLKFTRVAVPFYARPTYFFIAVLKSLAFIIIK